MTGTFLLDALGVVIVALCGGVFALALIATLFQFVYAVWQDLRGVKHYDQRKYGRSPDWPD